MFVNSRRVPLALTTKLGSGPIEVNAMLPGESKTRLEGVESFWSGGCDKLVGLMIR